MFKHHRASTPSCQRGLSLIVVLLSLVTLAFASVALIRSIDTGTLVMGNLGFKKAATIYSDRGADTAISWLESKKTDTTLYKNVTAQAYYATSQGAIDATGNSRPADPKNARPFVNWKNDSCGGCVADQTCSACLAPSAATTTDGYTQRYLISRLCACEGDPNGKCTDGTPNVCSAPLTSTATTSPKRGELKYGDNVRFTGSNSPYYLIIVRTEGPRNTVSLTETYVHF